MSCLGICSGLFDGPPREFEKQSLGIFFREVFWELNGVIFRLLLIAGLLAGIHPMASAAEANPLRDNWLELSNRIDVAYKKALLCEAGARKSDRSQCAVFSAYMKLFYPRIAYLNTSINQLPPEQLQKVAAPRDYENYQLKFNKVAEVSNTWGD